MYIKAGTTNHFISMFQTPCVQRKRWISPSIFHLTVSLKVSIWMEQIEFSYIYLIIFPSKLSHKVKVTKKDPEYMYTVCFLSQIE